MERNCIVGVAAHGEKPILPCSFGPVPPPTSQMRVWLVINVDLDMSVGKLVAQAAHGAVALVQGQERERLKRWEEEGNTKIAVGASTVQLKSLIATLGSEEVQVPCFVVRDAGLTEITPGSVTCVAIGPCAPTDVPDVVLQLPLLR